VRLRAVVSAVVLTLGVAGCSSAAAADLQMGECLRIGGTPDRPEAVKAQCGGPESSFKVVSTVENTDQCPTDVDSYYSTHSTFSNESTAVCMDVDWVVGGCMSIDPDNDRDPVRADCNDPAVPHKQRATQILQDVSNADQCASGIGYPYDERQFTVCVEDVA
jgi:hypothetical protein